MRTLDRARLKLAGLIAPDGHFGDSGRWDGYFTVAKYESVDCERWGTRARPYEVIESGHNLLTTAGVNALWQRLIGVDGTAVTTFASTNARLAVGDSTAAVSAAHTDLQAATNKFRKLVDGVATVSNNQITFVATFLSADANFAWNEAGIANAGAGSGIILNRVVQSFGTKTSGLQWVLTGTVAIS